MCVIEANYLLYCYQIHTNNYKYIIQFTGNLQRLIECEL